MNPKPSLARAVALMYNVHDDSTPRVAAKGTGLFAEKIIEIARKHDIPIRKDRNLLALLAKVDVMDEISPELFAVVGEILTFIYKMNERKIEIKFLQTSGESS